MRIKSEKVRSAAVALACVALAISWQALTVRYNYRGNWTALFCTGAYNRRMPTVPELAGTYYFPNSWGYDGQSYRVIAHDPLFQKGYASVIDAPRFRYRRILVSAAAYLAAIGQPRYIDAAFIAVVLAFLFLGVYWTARYSIRCGLHPAWGAGFVLVPSTVISLDRMTVDIALGALAAGWALWFFGERISWRGALAILAAAPLVRETGVLLNLASAAWLGARRRFRPMLLPAAAVVPSAAWAWFVNTHTRYDSTNILWYPPLSGILGQFFVPMPYPASIQVRSLLFAFDYVALAGTAVAIVLAVREWWRYRRGALEIGSLLFAALAVQSGHPDIWSHVYNYARAFSPLLLLLAMKGLQTRNPLLAAPLAAVIPRVLLETSAQVIGVGRGLLGTIAAILPLRPL